MNELDYIGADELVFNNDVDKGVHSGGFSVNSIMMKSNMSPIMTLNSPDSMIGGSNKVSDLFHDLVVPNWTLSYNNRIIGGKYNEVTHHETDSDDDITDDLHDKLLDLVKQTPKAPTPKDQTPKQPTKRTTKRANKNLAKKRHTRRKKM